MLGRHLMVTLLLILGLGNLPVHAAERCESLFLEGPHYEATLSVAVAKAHSTKKSPGLSARDLEFLIEGVFNKQEGRRHQISEYWNKTAYERTLKVVERQVAETVTRQGLLTYFEQNGLLVEKSRLRTKLEVINRSPTFNILSGLWSTVATLKGAPPVLLPEGSFKLKPQDFNTLLLKGTESPEGKEIISRYQLRMEVNRGYDLFSRYYTRVALAVLLYVVYDKTQEALNKPANSDSESAFEQIMARVESLFKSDDKIQSKEDILFATVLRNFKEKYSRLPDERELTQICFKVYGSTGCPK